MPAAHPEKVPEAHEEGGKTPEGGKHVSAESFGRPEVGGGKNTKGGKALYPGGGCSMQNPWKNEAMANFTQVRDMMIWILKFQTMVME